MPPDGFDDLFDKLNKEQEQKKVLVEGLKAMRIMYNAMIEAGFSRDEAMIFIAKLSTK